jgi:hypothetical protein
MKNQNGYIHLNDADVATIRAAGAALYGRRTDLTLPEAILTAAREYTEGAASRVPDAFVGVVVCPKGHDHEMTLTRVGANDWQLSDRRR